MRKIALAVLMLAASALPGQAGGYSFLNVGIEYYTRGDLANAIAWLGKALSAGDLLPDQAHVAYNDRGLSHARLGQLNDAISDYTAAIAIKSDDMTLVADRAFAYVATGQLQEAIADLNLVYQKQPDNFQIGFETGLVSWQLGNYDDARTVFGRLAQKNVTAWLWFQLANVRSGKPVSPIEDEKFDPNRWPNPLKALFAGIIDPDAVMKVVEAPSSGVAQACDANFYVGEWHLIHNDVSAGRPLLKKAAEICPRPKIEKRMADFETGKLAETTK
jgi:tetratricopeptide (TPR) repeat protein